MGRRRLVCLFLLFLLASLPLAAASGCLLSGDRRPEVVGSGCKH